jgi:hypothetical protein
MQARWYGVEWQRQACGDDDDRCERMMMNESASARANRVGNEVCGAGTRGRKCRCLFGKDRKARDLPAAIEGAFERPDRREH